MPRTILALGAHYDDCVFGLPGILLQAVQKGHRVVVLSLIGDYRNWPPVQGGREQRLLEVSRELAHFHGIEMRFLDFASGRFHLNEETKLAVAKVVAELQPDTAFMLWANDRHPDHEAASAISKAALKLAGRIVNANVKAPNQIYLYDNGPGHTIGFEPNTFVDVTAVWPAAMEWLEQLMAFVRNKSPDTPEIDPAVKSKTALARYRGSSCGATYAEAVWAMHSRPVQLF